MGRTRILKGIKFDTKIQDLNYTIGSLLAAPKDETEKTYSFVRYFNSELTPMRQYASIFQTDIQTMSQQNVIVVS